MDGDVMRWDVGDMGRALALSDGVLVGYHGASFLHDDLTVQIPGGQVPHTCSPVHDALCNASFGVVFPWESRVRVPVDVEQLMGEEDSVLDSLFRRGCRGYRNGVGRWISEDPYYDIGVCELTNMEYYVLFWENDVYIIQSPVNFSVHVMLCVVAVVSLSGILYLLRPQSTAATPGTKNDSLSHDGRVDSLFLQIGIGFSLVSTWVVIIMYSIWPAFVTVEDHLTYIFLLVSYHFYVVVVFVDWWVYRKFHPGMLMDLFVTHLSLVFVAAYSTVAHPFQSVSLGITLFRLWNKMLRFANGKFGDWVLGVVVFRIMLDSCNIMFMVAFGWNVFMSNVQIAALALVPLILFTYLVAKYVHLNTDIPLS